jgi:hypothetical protein
MDQLKQELAVLVEAMKAAAVDLADLAAVETAEIILDNLEILVLLMALEVAEAKLEVETDLEEL